MVSMEDKLDQIILELKSLNATVKWIDYRLNCLERSGQALGEVSKNFKDNIGTKNENIVKPVYEDSECIWKKVLDVIELELTEVSFKTWLQIIVPLSIGEDMAGLGVPTEFDKSIVECRYSSLIKSALRNVTNRNFEIEVYIIGDENKG